MPGAGCRSTRDEPERSVPCHLVTGNLDGDVRQPVMLSPLAARMRVAMLRCAGYTALLRPLRAWPPWNPVTSCLAPAGDSIGARRALNRAVAPIGMGWCPMEADSPDLVIAERLLDDLKLRGFEFRRVAPGEDGPLVGSRVSVTGWT